MKETENNFIIYSFDLTYNVEKISPLFGQMCIDKGIMPNDIPLDEVASKYISSIDSIFEINRTIDDVKTELEKITKKIKLLNTNNKPLKYKYVRKVC